MILWASLYAVVGLGVWIGCMGLFKRNVRELPWCAVALTFLFGVFWPLALLWGWCANAVDWIAERR